MSTWCGYLDPASPSWPVLRILATSHFCDQSPWAQSSCSQPVMMSSPWFISGFHPKLLWISLSQFFWAYLQFPVSSISFISSQQEAPASCLLTPAWVQPTLSSSGVGVVSPRPTSSSLLAVCLKDCFHFFIFFLILR